ncbi:MAG: nicotinamide mononucleotide transporter [Lachnospiraceae bacterium]|nr:nicotinamide mononucleotide transporter [Lachnospiraceae bacterium]
MNIIKSINNLNKFEKRLWLGSVLALLITFILSPDCNFLTMIASLIGVTALIFVAKGDAFGQLLTLIFASVYAVISFRFRYFGEMITYMGMTAPIALLSIITWLKNPYSNLEVKVNHLNKRNWLILTLFTITVTIAFYFVLKAFDTPNLFFSTISIATSFMASSLTMLRSPYYAIAYALNDIVLIVLWVLATMSDISFLPMVLCFIIFLVNDLYGFCNWQAMKVRQQSS